MIKVFRAIVAVAFCAAGVLAALHVGQAHQAQRRAAAERAAREAWLATQPSSPWEQAAEARLRWATKAERHRPACRAMAEFLTARRPLVEEWVGDADGGSIEVPDVASFVPSPPICRFLARRRVLFAEVHGDELRPSCDVCPSFASPARVAVGLPERRLARAPDEVGALVIIARQFTPETDAATSPGRLQYAVAIIDPADPSPMVRYRLPHGPSPRHDEDPPPAGRLPDTAERRDRLGAFVERLMNPPPD